MPTNPVLLGGLALVLIYSAYVAEVFRAGIESVHPSQLAAAKSLGLNYRRTMRLVVLPQATRRVTPALLNDFVALQKDCGLISVLGAVDAVRAAQIQVGHHLQLHPVRRGRPAVRRAGGAVGAAGRLGVAAVGHPAGCAVTDADPGAVGARAGQGLPRPTGARRRRPRRRRAPGRRPDRGVRIGEVDAAAVHRPARGHRRRPDLPRRPRHQRPAHRRRRGPAGDGHGVPVVQPVPAHDRAGQRRAGAAGGARVDAPRRRGTRPRTAGPRRSGRQGRRLPRQAVRRPAAAGGDRPRAGLRTPTAAARRDHQRAGPGTGRRGAGPRRRAGDRRAAPS